MTNTYDDDFLDRLKQRVERLRQEYADDPNVVTVGWGIPTRRNELTDEVSIIFYVHRKLQADGLIDAIGSEPIPAEIDGVSTDVQLAAMRPNFAGQRDENKYDPLRGGIASSNSEQNIAWFNGAGTLGILARDDASGDMVGLSNWHVWGDGGEEGDEIIQPGHPTGADHVEAVGKVAACGPLVTSLIEWETPSPLALALYGGAAAAAVAAAASDYRDPTRRGQDATEPDPGELTIRENVAVAIEYPELPLPGRPFTTDVKWAYARETERRILTHEVEEQRVNTQFLLGKMVVTDKATYQPGEVVRLIAAIWDYQSRPCDSYHVVAHVVPAGESSPVLRRVLAPTTCPRTIPPFPLEDEEQVCVTFDDVALGQHPHKGRFEWLDYVDGGPDPIVVTEPLPGDRGILISSDTLQLRHAPATRVTATIITFASPVTMVAIDATGQPVGSATSPGEQGVAHDVELIGQGIVGVVLRGGSNEAMLLKYCSEPADAEPIEVTVNSTVANGIELERTGALTHGATAKATRCCFEGDVRLPPDLDPSRWDIHLTVQNTNTVPEGTPPDQAATVIGGHLLSAHTQPEILGCAAIMLADHVFDVI